MLRGNWGFIIAVIGCVVAAIALWTFLRPVEPRLPSYQISEAVKPDYRAGGSQCEPSVIAKLPVAEAASKRDTCEDAAEQHRLQSNDLTQQTRAADAAREGVFLNYNQAVLAVIGVIVGLFTLIAAGFAAWYAKRAADETKASAELYRKREGGRLIPKIELIDWGVGISVENVGPTQVTMIAVDCFVYAEPPPPKIPFPMTDAFRYAVAIRPGGTFSFGGARGYPDGARIVRIVAAVIFETVFHDVQIAQLDCRLDRVTNQQTLLFDGDFSEWESMAKEARR